MARMIAPLAFCSALALLVGVALGAQPASDATAPAYRNPGLPVERRVDDLLGRMTLAEKARMLAGSGWMESFPIERPLPAAAGIRSFEVRGWPRRELRVAGLAVHWLVGFFVVSLVAGFAVKGIFGVEV